MAQGEGGRKRIKIHYEFKFGNGHIQEFDIELNAETLARVRKTPPRLPDWARLSYHQCPNCPLKEAEHPHCPVAANLVDVLGAFKNEISSDFIDVKITTENRTISKRASMADGVGSLLGVFMVTSGCPILDKLRPMVRTHLPFATYEETVYRVISMYTLGQFFKLRRGRTPDWELTFLEQLTADLRLVNKSFVDRIRGMCSNEANINAIVMLDCFSGMTAFALKEEGLRNLEANFHTYLLEGEKPPSE